MWCDVFTSDAIFSVSIKWDAQIWCFPVCVCVCVFIFNESEVLAVGIKRQKIGLSLGLVSGWYVILDKQVWAEEKRGAKQRGTRDTHIHPHGKGWRASVQETLRWLFLLCNLKSSLGVLLHCGRRRFCIITRGSWCYSAVFVTRTNSVDLSLKTNQKSSTSFWRKPLVDLLGTLWCLFNFLSFFLFVFLLWMFYINHSYQFIVFLF